MGLFDDLIPPAEAAPAPAPAVAAAPTPPPQANGLFDDLIPGAEPVVDPTQEPSWGQKLQGGIYDLMSGYNAAMLAKEQGELDAAMQSSPEDSWLQTGSFVPRDQRVAAAKQRRAEALKNLSHYNKRSASVPQGPAMENFNRQEGFLDTLGAFAESPVDVGSSLVLRSLPASAPSIAGGIGGFAVGGPLGAAAGAGLGSAITEYGSGIAEQLREFGADLNDEASIMAVWEANQGEILARAAARAAIVGGTDALTGGLTGRIARTAMTPLKKTTAGTGVQMAGGGGGEAAAEVFADEKPVSWPNVLGEVIAEGVHGGLEAGGQVGVDALQAPRQPGTPETPPAASYGLFEDLVPAPVAPALEAPVGTRQSKVIVNTEDDLAAVRPVVNAEPSEAQKAAGNYQKGHINLHGLDVSIETPKGAIRTGKDTDGREYQSPPVPADYGYIKRSEGADGDHVDIYVGPNPTSTKIYVIDQNDLKTGRFDEHKAVAGADSIEEAIDLYASSFDRDGRNRIRGVTELTIDKFKDWIKTGNTKVPLGRRQAALAMVSPNHPELEGLTAYMKEVEKGLPREAADAITNFVGVPLEHNLEFGLMVAEPLERSVRGEDPVVASQLETAFAPVRQQIRDRVGDRIKLYRYQTDDVSPTASARPGERATLSWTTDPRVAKRMAGMRPKLPKSYSDAEIAEFERTFERDGVVKIGRQELRKEEGSPYPGIYDDAVGGFVTDTDSVRDFVQGLNEDAKYYADENEEKSKRIVSADVPVDDIVWITDRAGQSEFIVRNRPGRDHFIDANGKRQKQVSLAQRDTISPFLTEEEREIASEQRLKKIESLLKALPSATETASVAYSGRAKRGWYIRSADAIVDVFGEIDAPRFTALLAATSPQSSVESNLINALNIWVNWDKAGRPTDTKAITRIMGASVQGGKGEDSILYAWIPNTVKALSAEDPRKVTLSGPKVNSFMLNLRKQVNEVTNDAWMANYGGVDQALFAKKPTKQGGKEIGPGKGPGYMAMSVLVRRAAKILTERTGMAWTPAEVQETVWSWAKTVYERARGGAESAVELISGGKVTHEEIASTPDFELLFQQEVYQKILEKGGYRGSLNRTAQGDGRSGGASGLAGNIASPEGSGIAADAFAADLKRAARRLDKLRADRDERRGQDQASPEVSRLPKLPEQSPGPNARIVAAAKKYLEARGLPHRRQAFHVTVDPARGKRLADAYEAMNHAPDNATVKAAYKAMADEVKAQYQAVIDMGLKVERIAPGSPDPYPAGPKEVLTDLQKNHLWFYPTASGFGTLTEIKNNPLLEPTEFKVGEHVMLVNDLFRVVHDVFGHGLEGAGFGASGEENAWQAHVRMFTPLAARAMTSETRGQNSWVNFGPYGEANRANQKETVYADQKTGLLPEWASTEGIIDDQAEPEARRSKARPRQEALAQTGQPGTAEAGVQGSSRPQARVDRGDGRADLTHWSEEKRDVIDPEKFGSNPYIRGAERERSRRPNWINRSYYGVGGSYRKEGMLRDVRHDTSIEVKHLYDFKQNPLGLPDRDLNQYEAAIKRAGFKGYFVHHELGTVAAVFEALKPERVTVEGKQVTLQQAKPEATFFSALIRAVQGIKQEKAPASHWMSMIKNLPGVKSEEIAWTQLEEFLTASPGTVTKTAVLDHLNANQVQVKEVMQGEPLDAKEFEQEINKAADEVISIHQVFKNQLIEQEGFAPNRAADMADKIELGLVGAREYASTWRGDTVLIANELRVAEKRYRELDKARETRSKTPTKFHQYQLHGGENYRELLLTLPAKKKGLEAYEIKQNKHGEWIAFDPETRNSQVLEATTREAAELEAAKRVAALPAPNTFKSSHFDTPNILAHIRFNERFLPAAKPNGGRVKGQNLLDSKIAALLPLDVMHSGVVGLTHYNEVRRAIVSALPVDVVNLLKTLNLSPEDLFGDKAVSARPILLGADHVVRGRIIAGLGAAARNTHARLRAEVLNSLSTGLDGQVLPALRTSDLDPSDVSSLLSSNPVGEASRPQGDQPNNIGAGSTAGAARNVSGRGGKINPADLTALLDAHAKMVTHNERGSKVLFIEEIQSDWHQAGRKSGYMGETFTYGSTSYTIPVGYSFDRQVQNPYYKNSVAYVLKKGDEVIAHGTDKPSVIRKAIDEGRLPSKLAPDAPFKTTWPELAMKRMIRYAAENDFDKIAWTTGAVQVDRYNSALRNSVDTLYWEKTDKGIHLSGFKGNEEVVNTHEKEDMLSDAIGKSMADQIINDPRQAGKFEGDAIQISDTGMAAFYDKILVNIANKLGKKFDAKVGRVGIGDPKKLRYEGPDVSEDRLRELKISWHGTNSGILLSSMFEAMYGSPTDPMSMAEAAENYVDDKVANILGGKMVPGTIEVPSIDITQSMRDSVMMGQPLFKPGPAKRSFDDYWRSASATRRDQIRHNVHAMAEQILGHRIRIETPRTIADEFGRSTSNQGDFNPDDRTISVAIDVALSATGTLAHESIHAMRDLGIITTPEWALLKRAAEPLMRDTRAIYEQGYRDRIDITEEQLQDLMYEEAVAELFNYKVTKAERRGIDPLAIRLINKIKQFLEALRNYFNRDGFRTSSGIFDDMLAGKFKTRKEVVGPGRGYYLTSKNHDKPMFTGFN